jgi:predicted phosphohydrolase
MKIRILSDLHLEFQTWHYQFQGEDAVFIAGDIASRCSNHGKDMFKLFESIKVPVFVILGNHDFYGDTIDGTINKIQLKLTEEKYSHVYFLNNSYVDFGGYRICGSTLFTDFTSRGIDRQFEVMLESKLFISDFKWIKKTCPDDYIIYSDEAIEFLSNQAQNSQLPLIFLTHWIPSNRFIKDKFKGEILNGYFVNDCAEKVITDKVKWWIYGHGHDNNESIINETKFICNPRGYPGENKNWIENLIIEI